ncbi:DUF2508 family protein [Clostridium isatidis]|uniref:DUF2508 domain-containing protein n=1 Tax=Clostridium isatidis TaxID=182773 RepID=A0A343JFM2_9CLOT|nr:DUF2508 family protein [Clostridium isatidis]ASW44330.1 hypothetical protein BEN51_13070 [Clostridium isatidis]NLZ34156.1 YaaL family protein [Clostridiales bacterium]
MDRKFILRVLFDYFNKKDKVKDQQKEEENEEQYTEEDIELLKSINETIIELEVARTLFNSVTDPQLIELAINSENAARNRFDYLLSVAKKKHLKKIEII